MRKRTAVLAFVLAVGVLLRGSGQNDAQSFTPGMSPRNITFTPIDTSKILGSGPNTQQLFRQPRPPSSPFNPMTVLRSVGNLLPSWPPKTANPPTIPAAPQRQAATRQPRQIRSPMMIPGMQVSQ
ncbi:MAG TPA: hypothetical protein VEL76_22235 [Gemmataceae bacterium]|nr:hypothetical protein [Gemmataceae bacterium]